MTATAERYACAVAQRAKVDVADLHQWRAKCPAFVLVQTACVLVQVSNSRRRLWFANVESRGGSIESMEDMVKMKTKVYLLLGLVGGVVLTVLAVAHPAMAADVAAPAYKAAPVAAFNWSGLYFGATAGGGMAPLPVTDKDGFDFNSDGASLKSGGAVGGLHVGYNWQFTPSFLVGLEGDFNWSSFKVSDTTCSGHCFDPRFDPLVASSRLDDFSTFRARFGLTSDRTLIYVTAGPALGHINSSLAEFNCPACVNPGTVFAIASDSSFHIGIAVGAGVEYALTENWILRGEYLHLDFSSKDDAVFKDSTGIPINNGGFRASSAATADIARLGVSYKVW
jgi:outer membrane immunogenic protein